MRSLLLVPAGDNTALEAAMAAGADAIVLDMVEAIGSREQASAFLDRKPGGPLRYVYINPLPSGRAEGDLDAIAAARPDGVVLAGAEGGADVTRLSALIRPREAAAGLPDRSIRVIASVSDTPAAVFALGSYAGSSSRLAGLLWDRRRLTAALGMADGRESDGHADSIRVAEFLTVAGAASAGVVAIDGAFPVLGDPDGLEAEALGARRTGFGAKVAIHPDQVPVINRVFRGLSSR